MFAPPGFVMPAKKEPSKKPNFFRDIYEDAYKCQMHSQGIRASLSDLECCRSRLNSRTHRRTSLRHFMLQHIEGDICHLKRDAETTALDKLKLHFFLRKRLRKVLGITKNRLHSFKEWVKWKSIILPVVKRLKAPNFSASSQQLLSLAASGQLPVVLPDGTVARNSALVRDGLAASNERKGVLPDSYGPQAYTGSSTFLKGTQSANPHNDYCQHFVDTGERPQNFIRDTGLKNRFEEYPKLRELIRFKDELIQARATPPMYLRADLLNFDLCDLGSQFDVILIEPPLDECNKHAGVSGSRSWSWSEIERLEIERIAAPRSFIWIWCGSGDGLESARKCLRKWGFRRCEDICWIKTNATNPGHEQLEPGAVFQRTKEHCLMGIHGTVRRSTDGDFIHANLDIDLIISEPKPPGSYASDDKPTEIFHIIEHFCQGRRRLHLFGRDSTLRAGWLTVGSELSASNFDANIYNDYFTREPNGHQLGTSEEIERLRPKSPPPRFSGTSLNRGGPGASSSVAGPPTQAAALAAAAASSAPRPSPQSANLMGSRPEATQIPTANCGPSLLGLPSPLPHAENLPSRRPKLRSRGALSLSSGSKLQHHPVSSKISNPSAMAAAAALASLWRGGRDLGSLATPFLPPGDISKMASDRATLVDLLLANAATRRDQCIALPHDQLPTTQSLGWPLGVPSLPAAHRFSLLSNVASPGCNNNMKVLSSPAMPNLAAAIQAAVAAAAAASSRSGHSFQSVDSRASLFPTAAPPNLLDLFTNTVPSNASTLFNSGPINVSSAADAKAALARRMFAAAARHHPTSDSSSSGEPMSSIRRSQR